MANFVLLTQSAPEPHDHCILKHRLTLKVQRYSGHAFFPFNLTYSARLLQQGPPEMFSQPPLRRLRSIYPNDCDKNGNFPTNQSFLRVGRGHLSYYVVKYHEKQINWPASPGDMT
jgi:hypothetical protein